MFRQFPVIDQEPREQRESTTPAQGVTRTVMVIMTKCFLENDQPTIQYNNAKREKDVHIICEAIFYLKCCERHSWSLSINISPVAHGEQKERHHKNTFAHTRPLGRPY